jgi:hypothetical protein
LGDFKGLCSCVYVVTTNLAKYHLTPYKVSLPTHVRGETQYFESHQYPT